jgi:hypothetical protein
MHDWNLLDNPLKSWKLREPSARIRARLFPLPASAASEVSWLATRHWLAPAMAVCLLALAVGQSGTAPWTGWRGTQSSNLLATVALNQPLLARYYAPSLQHDRNTWPKASFEWTNGSHALTKAALSPDPNDSRQ